MKRKKKSILIKNAAFNSSLLDNAAVDSYFRERGTVVRVTKIYATNPRPEHGDANAPFAIPSNHRRNKHGSIV